MVVTLSGMDIIVIPVWEKALLPICVSVCGNFMPSSLFRFWKRPEPMDVV